MLQLNDVFCYYNHCLIGLKLCLKTVWYAASADILSVKDEKFGNKWNNAFDVINNFDINFMDRWYNLPVKQLTCA